MLGEMLLFVVEQVFLLMGCSGRCVLADAERTVWAEGSGKGREEFTVLSFFLP